MSILDTVLEIGVGRRDRDHADNQNQRFRREDRMYFEADRRNQRNYDSQHLQRIVADAKAAGIHPMAALGAQTVGPATAFQSNNYSGGPPQYPRLQTDSSGDELNRAHAKLLGKQADLVDLQIKDSIAATTKPKNEEIVDLQNPKRTKFNNAFGGKLLSNPAFTDAESLTTRYGESEILETLLALVIGGADIGHTIKQSARKHNRKHPASPGYDLPPELRKKTIWEVICVTEKNLVLKSVLSIDVSARQKKCVVKHKGLLMEQ